MEENIDHLDVLLLFNFFFVVIINKTEYCLHSKHFKHNKNIKTTLLVTLQFQIITK